MFGCCCLGDRQILNNVRNEKNVMSYYFLLIALGVGVLGLAYALVTKLKIRKIKIENERVAQLTGFIKQGANAFLKREYQILAIFTVIIAVAVGFATWSWQTAVAFLAGAVFSGLAGFLGMSTATNANGRTTEKAQKEGMSGALRVSYQGGSVMGFAVVGLGLAGVSGLVLLFWGIDGASGDITTGIINSVMGFALGCSLIALFARVGGGIFTKAADVGADLVGKVEAGIPEDDPRNPAVIADNVGDNVGDVAGMGADLFESYSGSLIACLAIAVLAPVMFASEYINTLYVILFPTLVLAAGIVASFIGGLFVRGKTDNPGKKLNLSTYIAGGVSLLAAAILSFVFFESFHAFVVVAIGLAAGIAIGFFTEVYTSGEYKSVKEIAKQSETGAGTNLISGLAVGMMSTALPILTIVVVAIVGYLVGGHYGIALAAVGMLSTMGSTLASDAYGPIADNAGGIAEMAQLEPEVREVTDKLDAVGNTTAAIGKGFCIGSAALTSLLLLVVFFTTFATTLAEDGVVIQMPYLIDPIVIAGVLIGGMLPFLFSAFTMNSVGRAAFAMIEEVRRQFKMYPGIMEDTQQPDYAKCVDISTKAALKEMIVPGTLAFLSPIAVGITLGYVGLGGMLVGALASGLVLAIFMANAGGAWDNAKKYVEATGQKGSETHKASVVGDTVGDPFKDTSGPALNNLIKLMVTVAVVFIPLFASIEYGQGLISLLMDNGEALDV